MDETAFNYNSSANTDDDSCIDVVFGCMDETAFNYNSTLTQMMIHVFRTYLAV